MTNQFKQRILLIGFLSLSPSLVAQTSAAMQVKGIPKAGEPFTVTASLDGSMKIPAQVDAAFMPAPGTYAGYVDCQSTLKPGETKVDLLCYVPPDAVGGTYTLTAVQITVGTWRRLKFEPMSIEVLADESLKFPTSAKLEINFSQIQLLRSDSRLLSQRINALRESLKAVSKPQPGKVKALLISNLSQAIQALNQTEADFDKAGSSGEKDDHARVFFDDLRLTYLAAETQLNREYKAGSNNQRGLLSVSLIEQSPGISDSSSYNIPLGAEGTIRAMEENELAFNTIAATKSLTFDLKVVTEPDKARIFFKRRGDPYKQSDELSTTTLLYLTKAIWVVKAEKDGCRPTREVEFDPFHEPIPSVELTMNCGK